jgi:hypothetical protein
MDADNPLQSSDGRLKQDKNVLIWRGNLRNGLQRWTFAFHHPAYSSTEFSPQCRVLYIKKKNLSSQRDPRWSTETANEGIGPHPFAMGFAEPSLLWEQEKYEERPFFLKKTPQAYTARGV